MRSVNKVILVGNLTRDPDLKQTTSWQPVANFGIATNREWLGKDGQKQSLVEFHELTAWSKLAEICSTMLKKGNLVYIEGYLKTRSWVDEHGQKRYRTEIVVDDMIKLEKRPEGATYAPVTITGHTSSTEMHAAATEAAAEHTLVPQTEEHAPAYDAFSGEQPTA